jgi:hypothetical protein
MTRDNIIWSRYQHYRIKPGSNSPQIQIDSRGLSLIDRLSLINRAIAIQHRDMLIVETLAEFGVKQLIDIGCDFGSLLAQAREYGIEAVGLDPDPAACELAKAAGLKVQDGSVQKILKMQDNPFSIYLDNCMNAPIAITALNITHARWTDDESRFRFIGIMLENAQYVAVSLSSRDTRKLVSKTGASVVMRLSHRNGNYSKSASCRSQYGWPSLGFKIGNLAIARIMSYSPRKYKYPDCIHAYASLVVILKSKDLLDGKR